MARTEPYTVGYAEVIAEHLKAIERKHFGLIMRSIEEQLRHTPASESRNRKLLVPPAPYGASWELRCGPGNRFRVLYSVQPESRTVEILAIGVKDRNRLLFGTAEDEQ